ITRFVQDTEIEWTIDGAMKPPIGHVYGYRLTPTGDDGRSTEVVSYYDWSEAHPEWRDSGVLPVLDASALKATLGILERSVKRGYVRGCVRAVRDVDWGYVRDHVRGWSGAVPRRGRRCGRR